MPANKNALIRYKTIDQCLRNRYRRWTLNDLVEACSDALYDCEGITKGVSVRTVQADIQMMRSNKLGYNAPIEVYEHKYYRYEDPSFSITQAPLSHNDFEMMQEAVDMLRQLQDFSQFEEMADVVNQLQEKLFVTRENRRPIIHFDRVPGLKGLRLLTPLYEAILHRQTLKVVYQSFKARRPQEMTVFPYLLKEFRNRWFLFASRAKDLMLFNLALDRIQHIEPADVAFRDNPNFDAAHFFDDVIGVSKNIGDRPQRIRLWASREQRQYVLTKPLHPSQTLISQNANDGSCVVEIEVLPNIEFFSVVMSYGEGLQIISPRKLANFMKKKLKATLARYMTDETTVK